MSYSALADRVGAMARRFRGMPGLIAMRCRNDLASVVLLLAAIEVERPIALLPESMSQELATFRTLLGRAVEVDARGEVVWASPDQPILTPTTDTPRGVGL